MSVCYAPVLVLAHLLSLLIMACDMSPATTPDDLRQQGRDEQLVWGVVLLSCDAQRAEKDGDTRKAEILWDHVSRLAGWDAAKQIRASDNCISGTHRVLTGKWSGDAETVYERATKNPPQEGELSD